MFAATSVHEHEPNGYGTVKTADTRKIIGHFKSAPEHADFGSPEPWEAIDALWMNAVPALVMRAQRYRDERVPDQSFDRRLLTFQEALATPGYTWQQPERQISKAGKRLRRRKRGVRWSIAREHAPEFAVVIIAQGAILLALGGVATAIYRLYQAFFGG